MEINKNIFPKVQIAAFTTNIDKYHSFSIFKTYLDKSKYKSFTTKTEKVIEFLFSATNKSFVTFIYDLTNISEVYSICTKADAYILFIDLESENAKTKLEEIASYIKEYCLTDKKIYALGLYTDIDNKANWRICEEIINDCFDNKMLIYEYKELSITNNDEIVNCIDYILSDNIDILSDDQKHSTIELNLDHCGGSCSII